MTSTCVHYPLLQLRCISFQTQLFSLHRHTRLPFPRHVRHHKTPLQTCINRVIMMTNFDNSYWNGFQLSITSLCDWPAKLAPLVSTNEKENKNQSRLARAHFPLFSPNTCTYGTSCSDWLIVLFESVVIGHNDSFGFGFRTLLNALIL